MTGQQLMKTNLDQWYLDRNSWNWNRSNCWRWRCSCGGGGSSPQLQVSGALFDFEGRFHRRSGRRLDRSNGHRSASGSRFLPVGRNCGRNRSGRSRFQLRSCHFELRRRGRFHFGRSCRGSDGFQRSQIGQSFIVDRKLRNLSQIRRRMRLVQHSQRKLRDIRVGRLSGLFLGLEWRQWRKVDAGRRRFRNLIRFRRLFNFDNRWRCLRLSRCRHHRLNGWKLKCFDRRCSYFRLLNNNGLSRRRNDVLNRMDDRWHHNGRRFRHRHLHFGDDSFRFGRLDRFLWNNFDGQFGFHRLSRSLGQSGEKFDNFSSKRRQQMALWTLPVSRVVLIEHR